MVLLTACILICSSHERPHRAAHERCDVHCSLGVVLWELVTGEPPVRGKNRPVKCACPLPSQLCAPLWQATPVQVLFREIVALPSELQGSAKVYLLRFYSRCRGVNLHMYTLARPHSQQQGIDGVRELQRLLQSIPVYMRVAGVDCSEASQSRGWEPSCYQYFEKSQTWN